MATIVADCSHAIASDCSRFLLLLQNTTLSFGLSWPSLLSVIATMPSAFNQSGFGLASTMMIQSLGTLLPLHKKSQHSSNVHPSVLLMWRMPSWTTIQFHSLAQLWGQVSSMCPIKHNRSCQMLTSSATNEPSLADPINFFTLQKSRNKNCCGM